MASSRINSRRRYVYGESGSIAGVGGSQAASRSGPLQAFLGADAEQIMSETPQIVALGRQALARGERLCLATVVHVEGSAYRKPGARMLVTSGGQRAGTISGGCLESEVGRKAWWLTAGGARVERYSSFAEEDGSLPYGLGCGGTVSLLLEQGEAAEAVLAALERVLARREPAVLVMGLGGALESAGAGARREAERAPAPTRLNSESNDQRGGSSPAPVAGTLAILTPRRSNSQTGAEEPGSVLVDLEPAYWNQAALTRVAQHTVAESAHASAGSIRGGLTHAAQRALSGRHSLLLDASLRECSGALSEADSAGGAAEDAGVDAGNDAASDSGAGFEREGGLAFLRENRENRAPAYFVEYVAPPPALSIFGAGDDAQPVAALAGALGWRVSVLDGRAHLARRERFPQAADVHVIDYADPDLRASCGIAPETPLAPLSRPALGVALGGPMLGEAAVVLTHSYEQDRALLLALLPQPLCYLGILGPRHRTERLLAEVTPLLGLSVEEGFARLHSPIGLDLGAADPAAVALSIIAEVQAVLHGRRVVLDRGASTLADADLAEPAIATVRQTFFIEGADADKDESGHAVLAAGGLD